MGKLVLILKVNDPTDWVNPMVVARKSNGDMGICLDLADLNVVNKRQHYQVSSTQEIFSRIGKALKIKKHLDIFFDILDITEECKRTKKQNDPDTPVKMFLSDTTLQAWHVTTLSVMKHRRHILSCNFFGRRGNVTTRKIFVS